MTKHFELDATWVEVASGPCLIEAVKRTTHVHFGESAPEIGSKAFHRLYPNHHEDLSYSGTLKAWAQAGDATSEIVVTLSV